MYLTHEEELMLNGEYGEAVAKALKLIVRVGEALGAERLVKIVHAHASGISYDNIGDPGLSFIRDLYLAGGRVSVYSTYNPIGIEIWDQRVLPVTRHFIEKQMEIIRSLEGMGFDRSVTCVPYKLRPPRLGEHLAWGESSAVAVANSLYGARTNREGGPIALAAALTGRIYYWGLHLDENRRPGIYIKLAAGNGALGEPDAGVLGYIVGENYGGQIPYIDAVVEVPRGVQALCAAAAAAGSTAMCIIRGVSPEDQGPPPNPLDRLTLTASDIRAKKRDIATATLDEAQAFFTGCPHHDPSLPMRLLDYLRRHGIRRLSRPVWVAVPGYAATNLRGVADELRKRGIHILPGTCIVVSRLRGIIKTIATDSVKTAFYLPRRHGVDVALSSLEEFVKRYAVR